MESDELVKKSSSWLCGHRESVARVWVCTYDFGAMMRPNIDTLSIHTTTRIFSSMVQVLLPHENKLVIDHAMARVTPCQLGGHRSALGADHSFLPMQPLSSLCL